MFPVRVSHVTALTINNEDYKMVTLTMVSNATNTGISLIPAHQQSSDVSLSSSAMLVDLSFSVWEGRAKDKSLAAEVEDTKAVKRGTVSTFKTLLDCQELEAIKSFRNRMRIEHHKRTLPWSDAGTRIVSTQAYFDYVAWASGAQQEFTRLVDAFIAEYEWEVTHRQADMKELFDPALYPSAEVIRSKFGMNVVYSPVPEIGDFRVDIATEAQAQLREQYERAYTTRLQAMTQSLWTKLYPVLTNLSTMIGRLQEHEDNDGVRDGKKVKAPRIFDTLTTNVTDILELMETSNLANDPEIARVQRELGKVLQNVSADVIKTSHITRMQVKREVDKIIDTLPSLDF